MSRASKLMEERARKINHTRKIVKQFLYALVKSEGYGEQRLMRVLKTWVDTYEFVNDHRNDENTEMLMIDRILDKVLPETVMTAVGYEKLLDMKGREVK